VSPTRRKPKPKILLDEGFSPRKSFSKLNDYCDVKHIAQDFDLGGATDRAVYDIACQQDRLMIIFNIKDFKPMITPTSVTIIGVSAGMATDQLDKKLTSKIKKMKPNEWHGKYFKINA